MAIIYLQKNRDSSKRSSQGGYALYTAIILTGVLILISYATANLSIKQLLLSGSNAYNADAGLECAFCGDLKSGATSAFAIDTPGTITCSGQTISTGSQTVSTNPSQPSRIGGGGVGNPTSIFQINLPNGCAVVAVTKNPDGTTFIQSHGYNTCTGNNRLERGVETTY